MGQVSGGQQQQPKQQPKQEHTYNYTARPTGSSTPPPRQQQAPGARPAGKNFARQMPDQTVHQPPGAILLLGVIGIVLGGFFANPWQMFTTFTAFWYMFNPRHIPIDWSKQPMVFIVCGVISISFQFALLMLVFRIETTWKKHKVSDAPNMADRGQQFMATAVEVVQHVDLVLIWGGIGFIVDTIGDYTFISALTIGLDIVTSSFLIFCYAIALYALSTVALVRSLEYVWAALAAYTNIGRRREREQRGYTQRGG